MKKEERKQKERTTHEMRTTVGETAKELRRWELALRPFQCPSVANGRKLCVSETRKM